MKAIGLTTAMGAGLLTLFSLLCFGCSAPTGAERVGEARAALTCSSTTLTANPPPPIAPGGKVTLSATANCNGAAAEYLFAYQWPSNPATSVTIQNWSTQASVLWDTT